MIHRVKPTRRRRIENSQFAISLSEPDADGILNFSAEFDFTDLDVEPEAPLVVVAFRSRRAMRFAWGTVSNPTPQLDCRLTEIPNNPMFRLMILAPDGSGRILASRDRIKPNTPEGAPSLLWLEETSELGNEVWKLDVDGDAPIIKVNRNIDGISFDARQRGRFRALVMPQAMRLVLRHALIEEYYDSDDEEGIWADWISFVRTFHDKDVPSVTGDDVRDRGEKLRWIDSVIESFTANRFNAAHDYRSEVRR